MPRARLSKPVGFQVNAGKSSLLNALAQDIRGAVGPVPTTARATEHRIELEGRPALTLVDLPGLGERPQTAADLLAQAERADLIGANYSISE
jgi:uncharacterized protein